MIELEEALSGKDRKTASAEVARLIGRDPDGHGRKQQTGRIVATYPYTDESGELIFQVVRRQPKDFKVRRPNPTGGWIWNRKGMQPVIYRLPKVLTSHEIFITEGEKDVETLEGFGLVATCNPFGADKWRHEYAEYFRGKRVIVLPDNDEAGRKHATQVLADLRGIAASVRILELPGLPEKGDVSDWVASGGTAEQLLALVGELPEDAPSPNPASENMKQFRIEDSGVFLVDRTGKATDQWICPKLEVLAHVRDINGDGWSVQVRFRNREGKERNCTLPLSSLAGDKKDCLERLFDMGFLPRRDRKAIEFVKDYIYQAEPNRCIRRVNCIGWHDGVFVLPNQTIGPIGHEEVLFCSESPVEHKYRVQGTLDEWRQNISRLCTGNSRLLFAISCAFAAPLLDLLKAESCGFHFQGLSSTGKTTLLLAAGSVWGGNSQTGFLDTWRATANGMEARAALHNHALLCLDEISEVKDTELGEIIYALGNGTGKSRMTRSMTSRASSQFKLLFLSTGERSVAEVLQAAGRQAKGGHEVRLTEITADAGAGMGVFGTLHEHESPDRLAVALARGAKAYHGAPILDFLETVAKQRGWIEQEVRGMREQFLTCVPNGSCGEVFRVSSSFGIVAAAGELATRLGITGWEPGAAAEATRTCYQSWLDNRGGAGARDLESGVAAVRDYIQVNGAGRFQLLSDKDAKVLNRAGFKERDGGEWLYYILPAVFQKEVCRGYDYREVAKELHRRGHLRKGRGKHLTIRKRIEELGNTHVYEVQPSLMSEKEDEAMVGTSGNSGNRRLN